MIQKKAELAAIKHADDCYTSNTGTLAERDVGWSIRKLSFLAGAEWREALCKKRQARKNTNRGTK